MSEKIYLLTLAVDKESLRERIKDFDYTESKSVYIIEKESGFGGATTRLKKDKVLYVDSNIRENLFYIVAYNVWAFKDQIEEAKKLLKDKISEEVRKRSEASVLLIRNLTGSDPGNNLLIKSKAVIDSWSERMGGEKEEFKRSSINGGPENYWSPSASMVSSEAINELRKAIEEAEKASPVV